MKLPVSGLWIMLALLAPVASADAIYDAQNDYMAGWTGGNNPNGVWKYGWSTSPGDDLTLYTINDQVSGLPDFDEWKDPSNYDLGTPVAYSNQSGSSFSGGGAANVDNVPAGALIIHGGGSAAFCGSDGACFSEVIWTAPSTANYDLVTSFTGHQVGMDGLVEVIRVTGGTPTVLFSNGTLTDNTSQSFNQTISVVTGDQIIFAARTANGTLNPDTTQLEATLQVSANTPEPSTLALFGSAMLGLAGIGRRRPRHARTSSSSGGRPSLALPRRPIKV